MAHSTLPRFVLLAALPLMASCVSTRFYNSINHGKIENQPRVIWTAPNQFIYERDGAAPFRFRRANGELITPGRMKTDGGSVPRALWDRAGFSPWEYAPAYVIHDWIYESHRRKSTKGLPRAYTKEEADIIMAEVIKAQMTDDRFQTKASPGTVGRIYWAVSRFADGAWNGEPTPMDDSEYSSEGTISKLIPVKPLLDVVTKDIPANLMQFQQAPVPKPAPTPTPTPAPATRKKSGA